MAIPPESAVHAMAGSVFSGGSGAGPLKIARDSGCFLLDGLQAHFQDWTARGIGAVKIPFGFGHHRPEVLEAFDGCFS